VTDEGPATADGVAVERYHAQIDPANVTGQLKSAIAGAAPSLQQIANAMQFTDGSIDAGIDHQGRLVVENGSFNVKVDMGAVKPSLQGSTLQAHLTLDTHFYDYGAKIVVTKPANITGSSST
jgi:hypothetical protein